MALYDGFFDAVQDGEGAYDRAYGPSDFTGYFANVVGSGVCIHNNPDSFKAEYEGGTLYLRPGYLFIQGYWLANRAGEGEEGYKGYAVALPAGMAGPMAVVARLDLGQRLIQVEVRPVSQAYPDALVLAIVTADTAEDTRHNTDICGVIDTAGGLSGKVEWAVNYIDTEIESKLQQVEQDIAAQELKLNAKIAEVQAVADSIVPPPVGAIKFSASQDVGEEWLKCDGSFINESQYPELVESLGKLTPSSDKFQVVSNGEIPQQISNGALYAGRVWVYSYSSGKLYGVDVEGTAAIKEITLASDDNLLHDFLAPTTSTPIVLSIIPHKVGNGAKLFLCQVKANGSSGYNSTSGTVNYLDVTDEILILQADFTGDESSLTLAPPFTTVNLTAKSSSNYMGVKGAYGYAVPYVASYVESGKEYYRVAVGIGKPNYDTNYTYLTCLKWENGADTGDYLLSSAAVYVTTRSSNNISIPSIFNNAQRTGYRERANGEAVSLKAFNGYTDYNSYSSPSGIYEYSGMAPSVVSIRNYRTAPLPLNVVGQGKIVGPFDLDAIPWCSIQENNIKSVNPKVSPPSGARVFVDGAAYLWGKDIYMFFVGTGIIFSRTLEEGGFGYLDTTSVLGTITQFGYLDYSQDEGTLYLLGQDTTNAVKVAKIELNTLYDYANDGAWLPMIASDGVPAYIKAKSDDTPVGPTVPMQVKVVNQYAANASVLFNGESLIAGTYTRNVAENGKFTIGITVGNYGSFSLSLNNAVAIAGVHNATETREFNVNDYISTGVTLTVS